MSTQLTERPAASFPVAGRPRWRRRVAAGVAALALVLSSGLAGAYATTRLEDQPAAVATTAVTAATTTRAATGSLAAVAAKVTPAWSRSRSGPPARRPRAPGWSSPPTGPS